MADIFEVLKKFGEIEQSGGWPVYEKNENTNKLEINSKYPPIVIWRYKNVTEQLRCDLEECISNFQGKFKWILEYSKGKNWVLIPKYIDEIAEKIQSLGERDPEIYLMEFEPEFGQEANEELPLLADHILGTMKKKGYLK